jgi:hypothetical protein
MCKELGFAVDRDAEDPLVYAVALDIKSEAVTRLLAERS